MAITAPVPGLSLAVLAQWAASLPLPGADIASAKPQPLPDTVVFSSPPTRLLSDIASAGLRQLAALLPAIEAAILDASVGPLGQLAKAVGAASRQIAEGHVALLAEGPDRIVAAMPARVPLPGAPLPASSGDAKQLLRDLARQLGAETERMPDAHTGETLRTIARQIDAARIEPHLSADPGAGPIQRWLTEAKHVLRSTADALDRAEATLRPLVAEARPDAAGQPAAIGALTEITAAQAQLIAAYASLPPARAEPRRTAGMAGGFRFTVPLQQLAGATTLLGMMLIAAALWLSGGIWALATGAAGLVVTAFWVWRISRASRGVTLDVAR